MPPAGRNYTKGTVQQVFDTDQSGFPTNHIERDTDGQLWHVVGDKQPVAIDADEAQSIAAESAQGRHEPRDNQH